MDRETLIRAILECNFAGYDSDIIDIAVKRIMESAGDVIVHCKDCIHYNAGFECLKEGYGIEYSPEYYCADGERREERRC